MQFTYILLRVHKNRAKLRYFTQLCKSIKGKTTQKYVKFLYYDLL